jgi:hypothetical protein
MAELDKSVSVQPASSGDFLSQFIRIPAKVASYLRVIRVELLLGITLILTMRLVLGVAMAGSWITVKPFLPLQSVDHQQVYGNLPDYSTYPADRVLGVWLRWDAVHYLNIAKYGYLQLSEAESAFYPLYPALTRLISIPVGGDMLLGGLLISSLSAAALFVLFNWLARYHFGEESARWSTLVLASFPTALFFIAPYTESLYIALTLGAFIAAYKSKWGITGILGFLASLTRGPGAITVLALSWIAYDQLRKDQIKNPIHWLIARGFGLILPVLGSLLYLYWRTMVGFAPLDEIHNQYSGFHWINPISGFIKGVQQWWQVRDLTTTLDIWSGILFLVLTLLMILRPRWRKPEWLIYNSVNLLLFFSNQSFIASSLQSTSRYVLALFPAFLILGDWLSNKKQTFRFVYFAISGSLLVVFSMLFALWFFIG